MNKKILQFTIILTSLLAVSFIIQPQIARTSAETGRLLIFDPKFPSQTIYRGDTIIYGGTIFNNDTSRTYLLTEFDIRVYHPDNLTKNLQPYSPFSFYSLATRNIIAPMESRTFAFEKALGEELKIHDNYTFSMYLYFRDEADAGDETVFDFEKFLGNATVNVDLRRIDSPDYVYVVFIVLLVSILAILIIGIVGWVRERRSKQ
ncbi:MAG: hypothetical protein JXA54_04515 [Candidatus Heimdallarchaeota archaeon]|nr:hypothetical protein [Candidatus Heimdallarchaeota archaeon]